MTRNGVSDQKSLYREAKTFHLKQRLTPWSDPAERRGESVEKKGVETKKKSCVKILQMRKLRDLIPPSPTPFTETKPLMGRFMPKRPRN